MLTRSPVPARSPSSSPSSFHTSFHYVPSSPQRRSPKPPTVVSRRPSTSSPLGMNKSVISSTSQPQSQLSAPPPPKPKAQAQCDRTTNYVGIDAATQYSPMEPHDYFAAPNALANPSSSVNAPSLLDSSASQQTLVAPSTNHTTSNAQLVLSHTDLQDTAATGSSPTPVDEPPMLKAPHPLSPTKRRNSDGPGSVVEEASGSGRTAQGVPKRAKPDVVPPKVLPVRYELCAIEDIVVLIANMLAELIETNDALALRSGHLTRFHSRTPPGISVLDYLHRLAKHATLTPPLLLSMVYYIDRLCALYPDFTINTLTVHRFLITAATVAAKGLSDSFWNNSTYARVGGVRVAELKLLELEFLHRVDWKIVPDPEVLVAYYRGLVQRSPAYVLEDEVEEQEQMGDEDGETELSDDINEEDEAEDGNPEIGSTSTGITR